MGVGLDDGDGADRPGADRDLGLPPCLLVAARARLGLAAAEDSGRGRAREKRERRAREKCDPAHAIHPRVCGAAFSSDRPESEGRSRDAKGSASGAA